MKRRMYLVLFEDTPLLAFERLGTLFMVAPLDGIAHRGHFEVLRAIDLEQRNQRRGTRSKNKGACLKKELEVPRIVGAAKC